MDVETTLCAVWVHLEMNKLLAIFPNRITPEKDFELLFQSTFVVRENALTIINRLQLGECVSYETQVT